MATRVFLTRLLAAYGPAAPDLPRRIADELEWLEQEEFGYGRDRDV
jgi:hypothetical protein